MGRYVAKRLLHSALLFWIVTVVVFAIVRQAPGGPAILSNPNLTRDQMANLREGMGLDKPLYVNYLDWIQNVLRGDLGVSFNEGLPVSALIADRLPNTLLLGLAAFMLALIFGIALGVLSAIRRDSWVDYLASAVGVLNLSVPVFWLGIVLILVFAVQLRWLPVGGMHSSDSSGTLDLLLHIVMPAIVASGFTVANVMRYTRSSLLEVIDQLYITAARAMGIRERRVILLHAMKNAMLPVVTVIGFSLPQLFGGAAITETVFSWPGIGALGITAARTGDFPVILGITLVVSAVVILANLLTDLSYSLLDPRVKLQ